MIMHRIYFGIGVGITVFMIALSVALRQML